MSKYAYKNLSGFAFLLNHTLLWSRIQVPPSPSKLEKTETYSEKKNSLTERKNFNTRIKINHVSQIDTNECCTKMEKEELLRSNFFNNPKGCHPQNDSGIIFYIVWLAITLNSDVTEEGGVKTSEFDILYYEEHSFSNQK